VWSDSYFVWLDVTESEKVKGVEWQLFCLVRSNL